MARMTGEEARSRLESLPRLTSGSPSFDRVLGGGFRVGRVTEVYGKSNSGKSQLAMQSALLASKGGWRTLYLDTEGAFRPERIERMAAARGWAAPSLLLRITYLRCASAAEQMEVVRMMAKRRATATVTFVVVDTLTKNFSVDMGGTSNTAERQGALDVHLSEIARDAFLNKRAYLLTNRVTFSRSDSDVSIGGPTVSQLVDRSIRLRREGGSTTAEVPGTGTAVLRFGEEGLV